MPTRIRLARHGRKGKPFYSIVVADSRAPRDGRFIEKIGTYNPNTNPATVDLKFERALDWMMKGAQPSDTARAILSYEGVMMKKHLLEGARKGAFSEEVAHERFDKWIEEKRARIQAKKEGLSKAADLDAQKRLQAEAEINKSREEAIAKQKSAALLGQKEAENAAAEAEVAEDTAVEEVAASAEAAPATEEPAAEAEEKPEAEA